MRIVLFQYLMLCNESLFYVEFYDDKTSVVHHAKFLKNEIIKVYCILYPVLLLSLVSVHDL